MPPMADAHEAGLDSQYFNRGEHKLPRNGDDRLKHHLDEMFVGS
jgi:hypothetical protein